MMDIKHRIECGRMKWRETSGDKRIPMRIKDKLYKSVVRPTILCFGELRG